MSRGEESTPRRGEVWWVAFGPSAGGGIQKTRPAVIISNDTANRFLNRVQVIPITSKVSKLYPGEAYVTVNGARHKAMADQLTTASKGRLRELMGKLGTNGISAVERAIKVQIGLT
ncbi:MAG TPA: type II toxin-antitoxin system PemK/MazF family toxin [Candidatus Binataceae bacterium]|jgi:mRNA interferase MazF|nr:type II toxin-antitoxin system PemK/MazF family toxin [Candidatus Binataceae bacterium]